MGSLILGLIVFHLFHLFIEINEHGYNQVGLFTFCEIRRVKKLLIVIADMEGASGIFDRNKEAVHHGSDLWRSHGRQCLTSDVLAVCDATNECGIGEIYLYDSHCAGDPKFNIKLEVLPLNVKVFDTPDRCFFWRRIRGQAAQEPFGLIT